MPHRKEETKKLYAKISFGLTKLKSRVSESI